MSMAYYFGIALVSGATLLLEIALLRLFAVQQFYHFAFMAISLALLGAGASGSILSVRRRRFPAAWLCLAFGTTTVAAYLVINTLPFDSFSIAWDRRQVFFLALYFLAISVPFLFSGLLVGGELMAAGKEGSAGSHRVYGANLIGSALGSLSSLPALSAFGGEGTVVLAAVVGIGAGQLLMVGRASDSPRLKWDNQPEWLAAAGRLVNIGLLLCGLAALVWPPALLSQRLSPYKTLSVLSLALDARHVMSAWNATARVDVVESGTIHVMPGLSLASPVGPPAQAGLMLDGDNLMPIIGLSPESEEARILADHVPTGLAYRLRPGGKTLVIESGTGMDVLFALASGAQQVTAVEDNGLIIRTMQNEYHDFTGGLYSHERVSVVNRSGRVFARQSDEAHYDITILALTDAHRPVTSGAYSLTENHLYTVEAMVDFLNTLNETGILLVTRWLQTPPSESGRMFATVAKALENSGRDPEQHMIAFRTLRTMTVLASAQPVSPAEVEILRSFLRERGFDAVYYPGIRPEDLNQYNVLPEESYHQLFVNILADPKAVYADYRFDIRPPTDDHPFFFHFFRWRQTPEILAGLGLTWQPFGGSGIFVLVALLTLVAIASAVFIIGPLLIGRVRDRGVRTGAPSLHLRVFVYFAGLGLAFLFVEIPVAQGFILVLGQPVTALAVVIFALLLSSGLGSLTARRWRLSWALTALILITAVYPTILEPTMTHALRLPEWGRVALTVMILAPLGYLMGIPFASGLRLVEARDPGLVPWAWAINGSFSVISAVLAVTVALTWGFSAVLWLGAAAYLGAYLALGRLSDGGTV